MAAKKVRRGWSRPWFWILIASLVAADLISKSWAVRYAGSEQVPVLGSWLGIQNLENPGGLFGIGQELNLELTLIRIVAVGLILWLASRQPFQNRRGVFVLGLLTGGALGNLYDNLSKWAPWPGNGHVRDFIRVDLGPAPADWLPGWAWPFHPWPIFNFADSYIVVGFLLLLFGIGTIYFHPAEAPGTDVGDPPSESPDDREESPG